MARYSTSEDFLRGRQVKAERFQTSEPQKVLEKEISFRMYIPVESRLQQGKTVAEVRCTQAILLMCHYIKWLI